MAAKPARRNPIKTPAEKSPPAGQAAFPAAASVPGAATPATFANRPRLRQALLIAVWCYVAALWVLALDQTFHWGIFGPPAPPAS